MANRMRWRWGDTKPVVSKPVASAAVIEIGDVVEEAAADEAITSAADHAWNTDLATTQEELHDRFLGVAMQRSRSGDTDAIRVATEGVFEFDCASATFKKGALVGMAKQSGNALESQKVVAVATANLAIGRVAERVSSAATRVKVRLMGTVMSGGPYAPA